MITLYYSSAHLSVIYSLAVLGGQGTTDPIEKTLAVMRISLAEGNRLALPGRKEESALTEVQLNDAVLVYAFLFE